MKKASKAKKTTPIRALVITLIAVVALLVGGITLANAAAGQTPAHSKTLTANPDGTYTIALNVTGDSERKVQKVNVIVIVDRSGSMGESSGNTSVTYTPTNSTGGWWYQNDLYGLVDGEYVQLERRTGGSYWNPTYTFWYNGTQYTGQRYRRQSANQTRLQATQEAVNTLAESLLSNNGGDNPSDTVQMALVSFATTARTDVSPTTSASTFTSAVNRLNDDGGTNWEAALRQAATINFNDSDPTFVIFFSDGAPTFRVTQAGYNDRYQSGVYGTGQEEEPNMGRAYTQAADDAASLAETIGAERFYTIFAYGEDYGATYMTNLTSAAGAPAANNYNASDTGQLQEAFAEILQKIEMAGIANVGISDGTTSNVQTSSGQIANLLTVDQSSYHYYRAGGTEDGQEKYDSSANGGLGEEWADAPAATFENGAVKWNIDGVLENGVTYTVTFDCWPSQTTLDIIADIKNDPSAYDKLDPAIQQYIGRDGNLKTNTTATLTYTDTRTGESGSTTFTNPDPVTADAVEQLAVAKEWANTIDAQDEPPIVLDVTRDGTHKYDLNISSANDWKGSVYISIGIMRTDGDEVEILAPGHDFTFVEPEDIGYRWELDVPTVRPMLINGTMTMLIKVDSAHPAPAGADTYEIDGKTYYAGDTGAASLTATNYRRSQLVLTKEVQGEDVPEGATFPFTLNVVNSKASEGTAGDTDTDAYVWFLITDKDGKTVTETGYVTDGATAETGGTGYYYAESGTDISINLPAGYSVRFINLPKGSTYTFTEGDLGTGFIFKKAELTKGEDDDFDAKTDKVAKGSVAEWNSEFVVTFTNEYALVDVTVSKVWDDNSNQDHLRPTSLDLTLNGLPTGTTAPKPTITKSDDGNTWTYTWKGLPKYDSSGEVIAYTVTEETVPTGYTCETKTAENGGSITNKHEHETVDVTVSKVWDDNSDQDHLRPTSLELTLNGLPTGTTAPTPTVTKDGNTWTYTWSGLPKYDNDGKEINYTVTEETVPTGYEPSGSPASPGGTITNTHTHETVSITVSKEWKDENDAEGFRPDSVTVNLLADGTVVDSATLNESGSWTKFWSSCQIR